MALSALSAMRVWRSKMIDGALGDVRFDAAKPKSRADWHATVAKVTAPPREHGLNVLPTDAQVIGAVQRVATKETRGDVRRGNHAWGFADPVAVDAKGGYHMEYGYSCMGYEMAGAMGIKLAAPEKEVICFVGDGSYMMANSELATAVMRRVPYTVVLTDNRGYGCINRLQIECGGAEFNNMYKDSQRRGAARDRLRRPRGRHGRARRKGRRHSRARGDDYRRPQPRGALSHRDRH